MVLRSIDLRQHLVGQVRGRKWWGLEPPPECWWECRGTGLLEVTQTWHKENFANCEENLNPKYEGSEWHFILYLS